MYKHKAHLSKLVIIIKHVSKGQVMIYYVQQFMYIIILHGMK